MFSSHYYNYYSTDAYIKKAYVALSDILHHIVSSFCEKKNTHDKNPPTKEISFYGLQIDFSKSHNYSSLL